MQHEVKEYGPGYEHQFTNTLTVYIESLTLGNSRQDWTCIFPRPFSHQAFHMLPGLSLLTLYCLRKKKSAWMPAGLLSLPPATVPFSSASLLCRVFSVSSRSLATNTIACCWPVFLNIQSVTQLTQISRAGGPVLFPAAPRRLCHT